MAKTGQVQVRRARDAPRADDGLRVLVDRLLPRGLGKDRAHFDEWCKEVAPSTEMRRWYGPRAGPVSRVHAALSRRTGRAGGAQLPWRTSAIWRNAFR